MPGPANASNRVKYSIADRNQSGFIQAFVRNSDYFVNFNLSNHTIEVTDGGRNTVFVGDSLNLYNEYDQGIYQSYGIEFRLTEQSSLTADILNDKGISAMWEDPPGKLFASVALETPFGVTVTVSITDDGRMFAASGFDAAHGLAIAAGVVGSGTAADYLTGSSVQGVYGIGYGQSASGQTAFLLGTPSLGESDGTEISFLDLQRQVEAAVNWARDLSDSVPVPGWGAYYNPLGITMDPDASDSLTQQFWQTFASSARDGWTDVVNHDTEQLIAPEVP